MQLLDDDGNRIVYDKHTITKVTNQIFSDEELQEEQNNPFPSTFKEWMLKARPQVEGRTNILKYQPFMQRIYEDEHPFIQILFARQTGKSTYLASRMGFVTTTRPGFHANYVTYEDESLSTFSNIKFRQALWNTTELRPYVQGGTLGEVGRILLRNGAVNTLVTHAHGFKHLEGKSIDENLFDEAQYLDWVSYAKAKETQSFTQGKEKVVGIGGYVNTPYEKMWNNTDQREWTYSNNLWRDKLEFNNEGLVYDDYMLDVLQGHWQPTVPENYIRHGYHMTQLMFPHIPLTKADAIEKYKVSPEFSIEHKREEYTSIDFALHVEAKFIEGDIKPITDTMMFKLYDRTLSFTKPEDVDRSLGDIYLGVDWGGGSKTIVWIWQHNKTTGQFVLLWAEQIATSDVDKQYQIVKSYIDSYNPRQSVVDAGGGTFQVQKLESAFPSVLRRNSYVVRPENPLPTRQEEKKLRKENRYTIDRTFSIDRIINLITKQKMVIPAADPSKVDWIVEQFCNIEAEVVKLKSTGQTYRRYFHQVGRPDDALHSCNYAFIAHDISQNSEMTWFSA